jgi:hypothetical protein
MSIKLRLLFVVLLGLSFSPMAQADTCAPCGVHCGQSATNCIINQGGVPGYCEWSDGSQVIQNQNSGKVEIAMVPCE